MKQGARENLDLVIERLGIPNSNITNGKLICCCPVHGGDNLTAFNINIDPDDDFYSHWYCNTGHCHEEYGNDIVGLVRGVMESNGSENSFSDTIKFLSRFKTGTEDIKVDKTSLIGSLFKIPKVEQIQRISREEVRSRLIFPCEYYLKRGFSEKILDEFDVGLCKKRGVPMFMRAVFPVYDIDGAGMVGCVGRSVYENNAVKWVNSKGFNKALHLYGYSKAVNEIVRTDKVILVEGQGDVLKMHEAGITNTVGMFGCKLSDAQEALLERLGISTIILGLDNDQAGNSGKMDIIERYSRLFKIKSITMPSNDLGELSINEITEKIRPQL
jgi:5S rRNA maturation endonuclease (ribonuclease M5)